MEALQKSTDFDELTSGTTLEFHHEYNFDDSDVDILTDDESIAEKVLNPSKGSSFESFKKEMKKVIPGVWKKLITKGNKDAEIDLARHRVTCQYNFYQEGDESAFDSTYRTGKIHVALNDNKSYLEGFLEALNTMKEGEHSQFIIHYSKMFKEAGAAPRIRPKSDIFIDLTVDKIIEIGDDSEIEKLIGNENDFSNLQRSFEDARIRARICFEKQDFKSAIKVYMKIIHKIQMLASKNENERLEKKEILLRSFLNLAICHLKNNDNYREALGIFDTMEGLDENVKKDPKYLLHKGRALMMKGEYQMAKKSFEKGFQLQPSKVIAKALKELQEAEDKYKETSKSFSVNMFK